MNIENNDLSQQPEIPAGLTNIAGLDASLPWTMGMVGLVKWLSWETDNITGKSKKALIEQAIRETLAYPGVSGGDAQKIYRAVEKNLQEERHAGKVKEKYAQYHTRKNIDPYEAQRRPAFLRSGCRDDAVTGDGP